MLLSSVGFIIFPVFQCRADVEHFQYPLGLGLDAIVWRPLTFIAILIMLEFQYLKSTARDWSY